MRRKELVLQWTLAVTALMGLVIYGTALRLGFLQFGDSSMVLSNTLVSRFSLSRILLHPYEGNYYPLTFLSYAIEFSLFGLHPFQFHLDNVLLHILNALLVSLLLYRLSEGNFLIAAFGGILFAVHPVQVETVAWVSGRPQLLATAFLLLASHCYLRYCHENNSQPNLFGGMYILTLLFFILAILSFPVALVFAAVFMLFDLHQKRKFSWNLFLEKVPFFATASVFVTYVCLVQKVPLFSTIQPLAMVKEWVAIWWPSEGFPLHSELLAPSTLAWVVGAIAGGLFLIGIIWGDRVRRQILFGIGFWCVLIFPDLHFTSVGQENFTSSNIYLASLGLLYGAAFLFSGEIISATPKRVYFRPVGVALLFAFMVILSVISRENLENWKSDQKVWSSVLKKTPSSPQAYYFWGLERCSAGAFEEAITYLNRSIILAPHAWRPYVGLGNCYRNKGMIPEALSAYDKALSESPENPEVLADRGAAHGQSGNLVQAIQDVKRAVEQDGENSDNFFKLAELYERSGATDDAQTALQEGLDIDPKSAEAHHNLGNIFLDKSQLDQAALQFKMALEIDEKLPQTHLSLANVYAALGLGDRAQDEYRRAIEIEPKLEGAHLNLGLLLLRIGKPQEAEAEYKKAIELNPKLLVAHRGLAEVYVKEGRDQDAQNEKALAQDGPQ